MLEFESPPIFAAYPEVVAWFGTRTSGMALADDLSLFPGFKKMLFTRRQIHSNRVCVVPEEVSEDALFDWEGDAIATRKAGLLVAVRTADCVPVLLYDPIHRAVAAIHAGWRGIVGGIVEAGVEKMKRSFATQESLLVAAIGPAICERCFVVGAEVGQDFMEKFPVNPPVWARSENIFIDLKLAVRQALESMGLLNLSIESSPFCTTCHPDRFYSYRREGERAGRQLSFIGIRPQP